MLRSETLGLTWIVTIVVMTTMIVMMSVATAQPSANKEELSSANKLSLMAAIDKAQRGLLRQVTRQAIRASQAQRREARGQRFPQFSLRSFLAPSPDIQCANADCTRTVPEDPSIDVAGLAGSLQLTVVQPLYTFGKLNAVSRAAARVDDATQVTAQAARADIAVQVATAYFAVKLARELRWMLEDGAERIDKAHQNLIDRLEKGVAGATVQDRLRVEVLRSEVLVRLSEAIEAEAIALASFRALLGENNADVDDSELTLTSFQLTASQDSYAERAPGRRPEVRAARYGLDARSALVDLERARMWPDIAAFALFKISGAQGVDDPPSAFANDPFNSTSSAVGLTVRWDLNPVAQYARIEKRAAERDRLAALVEVLERKTSLEAGVAYIKAKQAKKRIDAASQGAVSARGWVASVVQADAIGTATAKDLADAYIAFFTAQARKLRAIYDWNVAVFELKRATGESLTQNLSL